MSMILYVIPCDDPGMANLDRLVESFENVVSETIQLGHRRLHEIQGVQTPWWGFMFSNEWIDSQLAEALPIFFQQQFDYLVLYKKSIFNGEPKVFTAPRIFRSHVRLKEGDSLVPENYEDLKMMRVLDGWIRD